MKKSDEWWTSLHISEKERIASKVAGVEVKYPECTELWMSLTDKKKDWIRNHCTKKHDVVIPEWQEGFMYSE